jgi:peptidoglycan/LPS O-acetylase OafA/YrhL
MRSGGRGNFRVHRIREFDGLRAVAVTMVVLFHAFRGAALTGGLIGVDIFFVLSGYLITTLLVIEQKKTGRISLLKFYARRACRLVPALWIVLAFCLPLAFWSTKPGEHLTTIAEAATYTINWYVALGIGPPGWIIGHTWSLAIEEQFYLIWPIILIVALSFGPRAPIRVAIAIFALSTAMCVLLSAFNFSVVRIYDGFDTRSSELFVGCILALISLPPTTAHLLTRSWIVPVTICLIVVFTLHLNSRFLGFGGLQFVALMAAWMIVAAQGDTVFGSVLRQRHVVYIGRISYGIYLWHYVLLEILVRRVGAPLAALIGVPLCVALAAASFEWVERPILRMSARYFSPTENGAMRSLASDPASY